MAATDPEIIRVARTVTDGVTWAAEIIATLLSDSLSTDRKERQKKRKNGNEPEA